MTGTEESVIGNPMIVIAGVLSTGIACTLIWKLWWPKDDTEEVREKALRTARSLCAEFDKYTVLETINQLGRTEQVIGAIVQEALPISKPKGLEEELKSLVTMLVSGRKLALITYHRKSVVIDMAMNGNVFDCSLFEPIIPALCIVQAHAIALKKSIPDMATCSDVALKLQPKFATQAIRMFGKDIYNTTPPNFVIDRHFKLSFDDVLSNVTAILKYNNFKDAHEAYGCIHKQISVLVYENTYRLQAVILDLIQSESESFAAVVDEYRVELIQLMETGYFGLTVDDVQGLLGRTTGAFSKHRIQQVTNLKRSPYAELAEMEAEVEDEFIHMREPDIEDIADALGEDDYLVTREEALVEAEELFIAKFSDEAHVEETYTPTLPQPPEMIVISRDELTTKEFHVEGGVTELVEEIERPSFPSPSEVDDRGATEVSFEEVDSGDSCDSGGDSD